MRWQILDSLHWEHCYLNCYLSRPGPLPPRHPRPRRSRSTLIVVWMLAWRISCLSVLGRGFCSCARQTPAADRVRWRISGASVWLSRAMITSDLRISAERLGGPNFNRGRLRRGCTSAGVGMCLRVCRWRHTYKLSSAKCTATSEVLDNMRDRDDLAGTACDTPSTSSQSATELKQAAALYWTSRASTDAPAAGDILADAWPSLLELLAPEPSLSRKR